MFKIDYLFFLVYEYVFDDNFGDCFECGKFFYIKNSKFGFFIGCMGYLECSFSKLFYDK